MLIHKQSVIRLIQWINHIAQYQKVFRDKEGKYCNSNVIQSPTLINFIPTVNTDLTNNNTYLKWTLMMLKRICLTWKLNFLS